MGVLCFLATLRLTRSSRSSGNTLHNQIGLTEQQLTIDVRSRILGTPSEETWPGVTQLPDYKDTFPRWSKQELKSVVPNLDEQGLDLLAVCRLADLLFIILPFFR